MKVLLSSDRQSPFFYRINIEYFCLYHAIDPTEIKASIQKGLSNNLVGAHTNSLSKSTLWESEHNKILEALAAKVFLEIKYQQKQFPIAALKRLPSDITILKQILSKTPNDHLCHFHLGWMYAAAKNHVLAERHFNVAALQSQELNPQFSCFAYRHLANSRFRNGKYSQALLAIEAAAELSQGFNPELQFERVRYLSSAQKTTQALPHLDVLVNKAPHYEIFALQDPDVQANPSLRRLFNQIKEKHLTSIQQRLVQQWKNDPLHLLDLDKELGEKNSLQELQDKRHEMIMKLSPLLILNEKISCKLIQERSRSIIIQSLNERKQRYIRKIEGQQECAGKAHDTGQWMLYTAVLSLIALGLSYAISTIAFQFNYHWPINFYVQTMILIGASTLAITGAVLLHFTPRKLSDLIRRKQKLEAIGTRLGVSTRQTLNPH